jgi:hypothetical protein
MASAQAVVRLLSATEPASRPPPAPPPARSRGVPQGHKRHRRRRRARRRAEVRMPLAPAPQAQLLVRRLERAAVAAQVPGGAVALVRRWAPGHQQQRRPCSAGERGVGVRYRHRCGGAASLAARPPRSRCTRRELPQREPSCGACSSQLTAALPARRPGAAAAVRPPAVLAVRPADPHLPGESASWRPGQRHQARQTCTATRRNSSGCQRPWEQAPLRRASEPHEPRLMNLPSAVLPSAAERRGCSR